MSDKTAIVTGGRRGIGAAIAVELGRAAFNVLVTDLERDATAEATLADIRKTGVAAEFAAADVSDLAAHAGILDAAARLPGKLACLVNNAGVTSLTRGDMLDLTPESWDRVMRINLRGAFFLTQAFARRLVADADRTPQGAFRSIVNITSANAEMLAPERSDYTTSKAALSMVTRLYAARLARNLINVYEVRPGVIRTDMTAPVMAKYEKFAADGIIPMLRLGEPADIGRTVAMLAGGALPYTTGEFIWVDGGWGLHSR